MLSLKRIHVIAVVIDWKRNLYINILQVPKGIDPRQWARQACEIIAENYDLGAGHKVLHTALIKLYESHFIFEGTTHFPILRELRQFIQTMPGVHPGTRKNILGVIEDLVKTFGRSFECREGYPIDELEPHVVLFEFEGCGWKNANLIVNVIMTAVSMRRTESFEGDHDPLLAVYEEAKPMLISLKPSSHTAQGMDRMAGQNIKLAFMSQPGAIADTCINACSVRILGLCSPEELRSFGRKIGLHSKMIEFLVDHQDKRIFVCCSNVGSFRHPFVFKSPHVDDRATIVPWDLHQGDSILEDFQIVFAKPFSAEELSEGGGEQGEEMGDGQMSRRDPSKQKHKPSAPIVSDDQRQYLISLARNPDRGVTKIDEAHGITLKKGNTLRNRLAGFELMALPQN